MNASVSPVPPSPPSALRRVFGFRRLKVAFFTCLAVSLVILPTWEAPYRVLLGRLLIAGTLVLVAYGLFERWPARLPRWLARWALQVLGVAVAVPLGVLLAYCVTTMGDAQAWYLNEKRLTGFAVMTFLGLLASPWIAVSALFNQIKDAARNQALAFELERSELERKALDARLRLLQARVEPHFLFNTLANVRELVTTGSPRASTVLESLIAYLRAAVPRLNEPSATLGQELDLVRAYLEVMHMRMPDRLDFTIEADEEAKRLQCPPMTLLTLAENAVRHGIDPSEEGGHIGVRAWVEDGRCRARVTDTGMGLGRGGKGMGTGLTNLRERLELFFGGDAKLDLQPVQPHGTSAELDFPARRGEA
ncbi:MAG: sensor histidine kinase [Burkholderiales bacterium]